MSAEYEPVPTELVAGKYQLTRLLGRGGMGSVWEGVHTSLGTRVAVKFIEAEYADSPEARARFENEARAAATLQSKHVVQVHDHGVMPDGRPYIVMEFLAGEPLDARLDRLGRLSPAETARIVHQVSRALGRAHRAGIIHRDLKPENVFLVRDEEEQTDIAKVVDFGIAKFTAPGMGVSSATRTGSVLGTPYFMSPEQARGLRTVDHRTDLWALGVIAFRCLVGFLPFTGEAVGDLLVKICTAPIPIPSVFAPDLPPSFDAWFARALAREPELRFQSAQELSDGLAAALGVGRGSVAELAGPVPGFGAPGTTAAAGVTPPGFDSQMTPAPMHGSGMGLGQSSGGALAGSGAIAVQTAAPFMQTPPPGVSRPSRAGLFAVLAVVGALVLFGGGGVLFLVSRWAGLMSTSAAPTDATGSAVAVDAPPASPTNDTAATGASPPTSAPDGSGSGEAEPESDDESAAAGSAEVVAAPPGPGPAGVPTGGRVVATAPPTARTASPTPVRTARPAPTTPSTGRTAPTATARPRPVTDVGY